MKVGDIVTQSDRFYIFWTAKKFKLKIIKIEDLQLGIVIHLNGEVELTNNIVGGKQVTTSFNICYLKLDQQGMRKNKLLTIYEQI